MPWPAAVRTTGPSSSDREHGAFPGEDAPAHRRDGVITGSRGSGWGWQAPGPAGDPGLLSARGGEGAGVDNGPARAWTRACRSHYSGDSTATATRYGAALRALRDRGMPFPCRLLARHAGPHNAPEGHLQARGGGGARGTSRRRAQRTSRLEFHWAVQPTRASAITGEERMPAALGAASSGRARSRTTSRRHAAGGCRLVQRDESGSSERMKVLDKVETWRTWWTACRRILARGWRCLLLHFGLTGQSEAEIEKTVAGPGPEPALRPCHLFTPYRDGVAIARGDGRSSSPRPIPRRALRRLESLRRAATCALPPAALRIPSGP